MKEDPYDPDLQDIIADLLEIVNLLSKRSVTHLGYNFGGSEGESFIKSDNVGQEMIEENKTKKELMPEVPFNERN